MFNLITSTTLKWLRLKLMGWMHYLHHSAFLNNGLGLFSIVGFPWLHHILSLADIALETKVYIFEAGAVPAPFSLAQQ
jgi:hypothetical protein